MGYGWNTDCLEIEYRMDAGWVRIQTYVSLHNNVHVT